jgi:hypothetical protein
MSRDEVPDDFFLGGAYGEHRNVQPQGLPCDIDKIFCCLIDVTYSALPI